MKSGRESKGIPSADLLVCFPSRSQLSLMPKPICSPARKLSSIARARALKTSPLIWTKPKTMGGGSDHISEPSSPKVTCAGQIKIRPKTSSCKSWQSVMEEIERIHIRKKTNWVDSFGFKKDIMQFLTCLRSFRFDFRCFKAFPESDFTTDDEEDEKSQENQVGADEKENSRTAFSKWFMVLQENREEKKKLSVSVSAAADDMSIEEQIVPPSNALLLMRCRSAPAKSWLEEEQEEEEEEEEKEVKVKIKKSLKWLMEEENKERLLIEIDSDFYKLSSDIAKETWVVSENSRDLMSRSRSWKS